MPARHEVFLAEDNAGDVNLLRIALKQNDVDCQLEVYSDGATALTALLHAEAVLDGQPELFVLDLNLPQVDGITLLKRLRSSAVFKDAPVIIWTTSDAPEDRSRSEKFGASRHICKPINLSAFLRLGGVIKEMLEELHVQR